MGERNRLALRVISDEGMRKRESLVHVRHTNVMVFPKHIQKNSFIETVRHKERERLPTHPFSFSLPRGVVWLLGSFYIWGSRNHVTWLTWLHQLASVCMLYVSTSEARSVRATFVMCLELCLGAPHTSLFVYAKQRRVLHTQQCALYRLRGLQ